MRITLLHSYISDNASKDEQDTLIQVEMIEAALKELNFTTSRLAYPCHSPEIINKLKAQEPDIIFNLVESLDGKSSDIYLIPAMLKNLNIPYTGANANSLLLTTNKLLTKTLLQNHGILTPAWLNPDEMKFKNEIAEHYYILKSVTEDASIGISQTSVTNNLEDLNKLAEVNHIEYGGDWFAEKYIAGREFNISLIADQSSITAFPVAELRFNDWPDNRYPIIDYETKWEEESSAYQKNQRSFSFTNEERILLSEIKRISILCVQALGLTGYLRIDFRVDNNIPYVIDINMNPSLGNDAGFIAAAEQQGLNYSALMQEIISQGLRLRSSSLVKKVDYA